jgi:hypothetical protein
MIAFKANYGDLNRHRRYQIMIGDLLDDWSVSICYGGTGRSGTPLWWSKVAELWGIERGRHRRLSARCRDKRIRAEKRSCDLILLTRALQVRKARSPLSVVKLGTIAVSQHHFCQRH